MRKKSHISLAGYLIGELESEQLDRHKKAFYFGSILPDLTPKMFAVPHEFQTSYRELQEKIRLHQGPWKDQEEKYRVLWDGIACWPYLRYTYKTLKKLGINMVTSTYPKSWTVSYETGDIEGMARAYSGNVYPNRNLNYDVDNMVGLARKFDLDGIIFHSNRSCKLMDFRQYEVQRRVLEACGVPSVIFDGDQTDPRLFSEAQYETRVQALAEMMETNRAKKGRAAQ